LSAPLPPQTFVWQATGHGGRIGEEMQPAWAWLPKSSAVASAAARPGEALADAWVALHW